MIYVCVYFVKDYQFYLKIFCINESEISRLRRLEMVVFLSFIAHHFLNSLNNNIMTTPLMFNEINTKQIKTQLTTCLTNFNY